MKILRYNLTATPEIEIPAGAVLLESIFGTTGVSGWFLADETAPTETRRIAVFATGQSLPDAIMDCRHLLTFKAVVPAGDDMIPTALHIFDVTNSKTKMPPLSITGHQSSKDPADWWKP